MGILLNVENLHTHFTTPRGLVKAVNGVDIRLEKGEILGIVGESGSGKSVMAQSLMRVVPKAKRVRMDGRIVFSGVDLMRISESDMRKVRGARISMVTQNPSTSLNPVLTVGQQLLETMRFHPEQARSESQMRERMLSMMNEVQLPTPSVIAQRYPFQLSGGTKQRIAIAMALMCGPELLIADEPTTALDVTIQAQILNLLYRRVHDLGVGAQLCDTVAVMYGGKIVEYNSVKEIFGNPRHPYSQGLLASNPVFGRAKKQLHAMSGQPPDLATLQDGCAFAPRCSIALADCYINPPKKIHIAGDFQHMCSIIKVI